MERTLTAKEFKLLQLIESRPEGRATQRDLAAESGFSVGSVNKLVSDLTARGLLDSMAITDEGLAALEPYRVRRAVLIAAGFGERLVPVTLNTPKPLVRVHGRRIIDSLLDALGAAGIDEIYIVRGYLGEQFDQLLYRYPNVRFIENEAFNEANNISSAFAARDLLGSAYVLESDILLKNPELITRYQYESNYVAFPVERTDDWCFTARRGVIDSMAVGGIDCYQMCGISFWTEEDGRRLAEDIPRVMEMPGGKERYWDEVALRYCKDRYRVAIRECRREDLVEIDTFAELQGLDAAYRL
ncbi:MAG: NTP transferase domain-containing protein [Eggerthellaceae bacterium]|nr:NTP transferase domain-containing protein [Eggerthellaceae bacterium]